jgi:hypothetical protein
MSPIPENDLAQQKEGPVGHEHGANCHQQDAKANNGKLIRIRSIYMPPLPMGAIGRSPAIAAA